MATTTFRDQIAGNKRKSTLLVVLFVLFSAVVIGVLGLAILMMLTGVTHLDWGHALLVGGFAFALSLLIALWGYFDGDSVILMVSGARQIHHADDPELFNVVEEMAIAAGVPMPKVYIINDSAPNAFATGRDPAHGVVAITTGLRDKLTREELQGVMAHEMAHIRNYDIRLMLLIAVLVGTIVMLSDFFRQMIFYSGSPRTSSYRDDRQGDGKGTNLAMIVVYVLAILLAILAPLLAAIIQMAVSRQREYLADATSVQFTRNPTGLANALRKIDADPDVLEAANRGNAHLFIANPIKKFEARAAGMWASHPPIAERIKRLESLLV